MRRIVVGLLIAAVSLLAAFATPACSAPCEDGDGEGGGGQGGCAKIPDAGSK